MKGLKAGIPLYMGLAAAFFLFAGCGRHRTQVNPPALKPSSAPSAKSQAPAGKPGQTIPPSATQEKGPESAAPVNPPTAETYIPGAERITGPLIRIGLTTDSKEIRIASTGDYYVTEKVPEAPQQAVQGDMRVRIEEEVNEDSAAYRIQVAAFTKMDLAAELKDKLSGEITEPVVIHENKAAGLIQVRVGEFASKYDAQQFQKSLVKLGYDDSFVVKDSIISAGGGITLAARGSNSFFRLSKAGFLIRPSTPTVFLSLDGKLYRGMLDIALNKNGRITAVNQIGMEEYLLGVVPAEISPSTYPEPAALAAQAITARTYALFHLGKYKSDGFDLTDDTHTQVYSGVGVEKAATNDAVRQTYGLAIYYQDKVIDAMFMSTCGGRTEDFANVYDTAPVPYLKSVFCAIESGPEKGETIILGRHALDKTILADDGSLANRNLELAQTLGLNQSHSDFTPDALASPAEKAEIVRWVQTAARLTQKTVPSGDRAPNLRTRAGFFQYAAEILFGSSEIKQRVSPSDVDYFLGNLKDGDDVPETARPALAYIIQNGLWRTQTDNTVRPNEPICRGDVLSLLARWIEYSRPDVLRKGVFVSPGIAKDEGGAVSSITIKWGNKTQEFRFAEDPFLFRLDVGRTTPVNSLRIIGNEKIAFHLNSQGAIDFLEAELNPTGASSDRYSPLATWNTTLTRSAIAEKLRGITGGIGEFRDLAPSKTGESGRAVRIQVTGSRGSIDLNGYKVRNALGLRDTLFTIKREYNPDGTIASFTFNGRGYGHGVGLCQVGAFGMARAGRSYEEIIKTYFQGVKLRKAY